MPYTTVNEKDSELPRLEAQPPSTPRSICHYLNPFSTCFPLSRLFTSMPRVLYGHLPSNSIRLLHIHPGEPGTPIYCSLKLARIDDSLPEYEALSYVWGKQDVGMSIWLNGHKHTSGARLPKGSGKWGKRVIWVDALCINQKLKDEAYEKHHQVGLMREIYSRASRVLVWLGTDDSYQEAAPAFAILNAMAKANTHVGPGIPLLDSESEWVPVMALFINTWFTRMWAIQELVFARSATFIWGQEELSWEVISAAVGIIRACPALVAELETRQLTNAFLMHHLRNKKLSDVTSAHPFLHLLDLSRSFDVTYPEDKVFGLLGFTACKSKEKGTEMNLFIDPDYTRSPKEIYTDVARKLIQQSGNLDVLSYAMQYGVGGAEEVRKEEEMPTWVADWSSKNVVYPIAGLGPESRHMSGMGREMNVAATENPGIIKLAGVRVDVVEHVSKPVPFKHIREFDDEFKKLMEWCIKSRGSKDIHTAETLASMLTAGRQADGTLVKDPESHLADFCAYICEIDKTFLSTLWPSRAERLAVLAKENGNLGRARKATFRVLCHRSAFVTGGGRLALGLGGVRRGDIVAVLWGAQVPFVLRRGDEEVFELR
ncbi:hypothetical protein K504DRAFT_111121 [Pleomassaria siparia CBS 279.74]|uniref:Heterokaryon incompatibility domain-containing protein n=1 Tax=Pleomassaria siparia CBS 279.74 TaxID=1314801 RepID=A0A6G1JX60_9PLEO|nr:hypothetical protein K504DRAFT_111121 [Pleomassaria siparia CBS 279.74]